MAMEVQGTDQVNLTAKRPSCLDSAGTFVTLMIRYLKLRVQCLQEQRMRRMTRLGNL